jgi:hypothetical protein
LVGADAAAIGDVVEEDCMEKGGFEGDDACEDDRLEREDADVKFSFRNRELRVLFFSCSRTPCDRWG